MTTQNLDDYSEINKTKLRSSMTTMPPLDRQLAMETERRILITVELFRWVVLVVPLFLAAWRYGELAGYTVFVSGADERAQYWGIVSAIIFGASLVIYLPVKVYTTIYQLKHGILGGMRWRPSMLTYILLSAAPTLVIILIAAKFKQKRDDDVTTTPPFVTSPSCPPPASAADDDDMFDPLTILTLQLTILGLTLTEWMSKFREEHLTFDLVTAMADDFFFAYDVVDFVTMATREPAIYRSAWLYVCFAFSFTAMFKYVPSPGTRITGVDGPRSRTAILVSLFCCELPFVVVRFWTLAEFQFSRGLFDGDVLHPLKNVALIGFDVTQLAIIARHRDKPEPPTEFVREFFCEIVPEKRRARCPDEDGDDASDYEGSKGDINARARQRWNLIRRRLVTPTTDGGSSTVHDNATFQNETTE